MLNYEYHLGPRHTKNSTLKRGVRGNLDPQATFNIEEGARELFDLCEHPTYTQAHCLNQISRKCLKIKTYFKNAAVPIENYSDRAVTVQ